MSFQEKQITEKAIKEAKKLKKKLAKEMVDHLPQEESAVSVFMAGSPGAGKTETARNMIKTFKKESGVDLVHIENDELRKAFEDYDGINSPLFQRPATLLVEAIHDRALKRDVSFILDSTLSSLEKAKDNIQRSLKRNRYVLIIFVYQEPEQAWCLVKAREIVEGRRVPEEVFVNQFMESQRVVSELKKLFQNQVDIIFIEKNIDGRNERPHFNVSDIDALLRKKYNRESLEAIVGLNK
ncbi:zeta toxin family protein [Vibrio parahaemolyticus]|uniref:zeta toxin family protein n=1 Tax=Vibrio parahaemolyticus TaxID=670 RepID=UPI00111CD34A|nr:zeta toxin family protein [Vibrio parahaemolyticus]MBE5192781.1 AAA family ATPase [Vibrio parahaemolyticus]MCG6510451.1 zeta toxin family protein [Vibrio parahaemolyticus]TOI43154.1 zeta toxin family protein [Vibrio parahaemolyticus]HCE2108561.1 zeta toxin family protein [Vibrio parahaemolyticus]HCG6302143.1 zeta toxin family protein [Vibrio parahaemolyticus]